MMAEKRKFFKRLGKNRAPEQRLSLLCSDHLLFDRLTFQAKGRVQRAHRQLQVLVLDDDGGLDLAGGDHADVDAFARRLCYVY